MEIMEPQSPMLLSARALEDYNLVGKALKGDQSAFAALLDRYRPAIFQLLFRKVQDRTLANDLTIETFGKAFYRIQSYAPTHAFRTWLFRIATNNYIDFLRRKHTQTISCGDPYGGSSTETPYWRAFETGTPSPEDDLIHQQRLLYVQKLLKRLPDHYRTMVELRYYEELSYEEIAQHLQLPLGTVKAQLFRAKDILYHWLRAPEARGYVDTRKIK